MSLVVRPAVPGDADLIYALVRELADYEKLTQEVAATRDLIADALFGPRPMVFAAVAEWDGTAAGFAVWLVNYSTFSGRHGIYLEDLFVRPAFRRRGIGRALLAHLARRCLQEGWTRFQWSVLDWNAPAIEFYKSLGAVMQDEWRLCRLGGEALARLAGQEG